MEKPKKEAYILGPDGPLFLRDLPQPGSRIKWTPRLKWMVVAAVDAGLLSLGEACERYNLSVDEFSSWQKGKNRFGLEGLKATKRKKKPAKD